MYLKFPLIDDDQLELIKETDTELIKGSRLCMYLYNLNNVLW